MFHGGVEEISCPGPSEPRPNPLEPTESCLSDTRETVRLLMVVLPSFRTLMARERALSGPGEQMVDEER